MMLDDSSSAQELLDAIKKKLTKFMHYDGDDSYDEFVRQFGETPYPVIQDVLDQIKNPLKSCQAISSLVR